MYRRFGILLILGAEYSLGHAIPIMRADLRQNYQYDANANHALIVAQPLPGFNADFLERNGLRIAPPVSLAPDDEPDVLPDDLELLPRPVIVLSTATSATTTTTSSSSSSSSTPSPSSSSSTPSPSSTTSSALTPLPIANPSSTDDSSAPEINATTTPPTHDDENPLRGNEQAVRRPEQGNSFLGALGGALGKAIIQGFVSAPGALIQSELMKPYNGDDKNGSEEEEQKLKKPMLSDSSIVVPVIDLADSENEYRHHYKEADTTTYQIHKRDAQRAKPAKGRFDLLLTMDARPPEPVVDDGVFHAKLPPPLHPPGTYDAVQSKLWAEQHRVPEKTQNYYATKGGFHPQGWAHGSLPKQHGKPKKGTCMKWFHEPAGYKKRSIGTLTEMKNKNKNRNKKREVEYEERSAAVGGGQVASDTEPIQHKTTVLYLIPDQTELNTLRAGLPVNPGFVGYNPCEAATEAGEAAAAADTKTTISTSVVAQSASNIDVLQQQIAALQKIAAQLQAST